MRKLMLLAVLLFAVCASAQTTEVIRLETREGCEPVYSFIHLSPEVDVWAHFLGTEREWIRFGRTVGKGSTKARCYVSLRPDSGAFTLNPGAIHCGAKGNLLWLAEGGVEVPVFRGNSAFYLYDAFLHYREDENARWSIGPACRFAAIEGKPASANLGFSACYKGKKSDCKAYGRLLFIGDNPEVRLQVSFNH